MWKAFVYGDFERLRVGREKKRNVYIALHWVYIKSVFDRENEQKVYIGASDELQKGLEGV